MRQGDAAGTIQDVISCYDSDWGMYNAAYWQGSLYVPSRHIKHDFLLRYVSIILTLTHSTMHDYFYLYLDQLILFYLQCSIIIFFYQHNCFNVLLTLSHID